MTETTAHLRNSMQQDYYLSEDDCKKHFKNSTQTNPRFPLFKQTHYTAGSVDQFEEFRNRVPLELCFAAPDTPLSGFENVDWPKYAKQTTMSVDNTFNYIFHKFKKGIFVQIKDGRLAVFLPFSKHNYVNEWHDRIRVPPRFEKKQTVERKGRQITLSPFEVFIRHVQSLDSRRHQQNIHADRARWYGNNCIFRYEYPIGEGDSGVCMFRDMLATLCEARALPDIEFFINRRDFPIITRDGTEAYDYMFGDATPLLSHEYSTYSPILSMVTTDRNADIPIPTWDDWARVSALEDGKLFPKDCSQSVFDPVPFADKIPKAVFRGGTTGCGTTIESNPRLGLAHLSTLHPDLLDAGITNWNLRPRKTKDSPYLQFIDPGALPFGLVDRLTPAQQMRYKYIVNVDGHVSAYRLGNELRMGSVILLVESRYRMWFHRWLEPYKHYVPIRRDLSDLLEKIRWCRAHETECVQIADNAVAFYEQFLTKRGILDYMQSLLCRLKKNASYMYIPLDPFTMELDRERALLAAREPPAGRLGPASVIPFWQRNTELHAGVAMALQRCILDGVLDTYLSVAEGGKTAVGTFLRKPVFVKRSTDPAKMQEILHERFVGTFGTNNLHMPNFAYVYAGSETQLLSEHIPGQSFQEALAKGMGVQTYAFILAQLAVALYVAQQQIGLQHNDLRPWNIMLLQAKSRAYTYPVNNRCIELESSLVPVIVDYGKSKIIRDVHAGFINMYATSRIGDIVSILVTSLIPMLEQSLGGADRFQLVRLANFLSGTYTGGRTFQSPREVLAFCRNAKGYTEMTYSDKGDLERADTDGAVADIRRRARPHHNMRPPGHRQSSGGGICIPDDRF
jgi:hypothetical protein